MRHDPIRPQQWLHPQDCPCDAPLCRRDRAAAADPRPLGIVQFAWHAAAGIVAGNAIAFAWDWHGALSALADCFRWAL